jgi:hypothetical protein
VDSELPPLPDALEDSDLDGEYGSGAAAAHAGDKSQDQEAGAEEPQRSSTPPVDLQRPNRHAAKRKRLRSAAEGVASPVASLMQLCCAASSSCFCQGRSCSMHACMLSACIRQQHAALSMTFVLQLSA